MQGTKPAKLRRRVPRAPVQQALFKPRGGKRPGAGRPRKTPRGSSSHKERPALSKHHPVHVVLRTAEAVGGLRRRRLYHAIRWATYVTGKRQDFQIVQLSIQRTHIHLLVEARDKTALSKGMQGFQISAAKHINVALSKGRPGPRRRGKVFAERYHAVIIKSPRQARHALVYVLANWRKHGEDRREKLQDWKIDWFSSAVSFPDWTEYGDAPFLWQGPPGYEHLLVRRPSTWLLKTGWKKHGASISCFEVPASAAV